MPNIDFSKITNVHAVMAVIIFAFIYVVYFFKVKVPVIKDKKTIHDISMKLISHSTLIVIVGICSYFYVPSKNEREAVNDKHARALFIEAMRENDDDPLILLYSKAIELKPNYSQAYNCRGWLYLKQNLFDKAISDFKNALKYFADNDDPHKDISVYQYNLACAYSKRCSKKSDKENALLYLHIAANNGYKYKKKAIEDPDLKCIRDDVEYRDKYFKELDIIKGNFDNM